MKFIDKRIKHGQSLDEEATVYQNYEHQRDSDVLILTDEQLMQAATPLRGVKSPLSPMPSASIDGANIITESSTICKFIRQTN